MNTDSDTDGGNGNGERSATANVNLPATTMRLQLTGKNKSVVQTLFGREMGMTNFSRSSEWMGNGLVEKSLGRLCIQSRVKKCDGDATGITPKKLDLNHGKVSKRVKENKRKHCDWVKIELKKNVKVAIMDSLLWERTSHGIGKNFTQKFYQFESDFYQGVKKHQSPPECTPGTLTDFELYHYNKYFGITVKNSVYLYSLTDKGVVYAYDTSNKRFDSSLTLVSTLNEPVRFTTLQVESQRGRMHIIATSGGLLKSIYTIRHPPWMIENIIHVKFPIRMELNDLGAIILRNREVEIIDLADIENTAELTSDLIKDTQSINANCTFGHGIYEKMLKKLPEPLEKVKTTNAFFGILYCVWPPLYYSQNKNTFQIANFSQNKTLWEYKSTHYAVNYLVPMSDGSPHVLFLTDDEYKLLSLRQVEKGTEGLDHEVTSSKRLNIDQPRQETTSCQRLRRDGLRPRSSISTYNHCSYIIPSDSNYKILGVGYCELTNLIALLYANQEDMFGILYEAHTLNFFKRLPPVKTWPMSRRRGRRYEDEDRSVSKRDEISVFSVNMDFEFLYVVISYTSESEVYCFRLLDEH